MPLAPPHRTGSRPGSSSSARREEKPTADKQIAGSVRFGRKVTFYPLDMDAVTGYVGGFDRYTYFVLVPNLKALDDPNEPLLIKWLIHKASTHIQLHDESTFDKEPEEIRYELKEILHSFKMRIIDEYFSRDLPNPPGT